ncbi:hypothetical protein Krac_0484 [Ktedonobacter racemifer DSM 44963]|uniref:Uncharacterized protein n=1 Tax=Ktedonobacter racemifer DSM 44963 TaxID=485913 RepID=D6U7U2_KTERA|nr:hypothetical protein Krac_0484 [Ktedonobacter racemifer DSM 44963]
MNSGVTLVECPNCASTRTLEPRNGMLRFPSHAKRKTRTSNTEQQWAMVLDVLKQTAVVTPRQQADLGHARQRGYGADFTLVLMYKEFHLMLNSAV